MNDASAILAALDKFVERFTHPEEWSASGQSIRPMATINPLTSEGSNHSGHCGHPKQKTIAGTERCDSHLSLAKNSGASLAREVLSIDGSSGKSGKSVLIQELACNHRENADGHSGKSPSNQQLASGSKGTRDQAGPELATPPDACRLDLTIWSDLYEERAAHRQFEGGYPRLDAELLAWREVEWRWHLEHRERVAAEVCAGCGQLVRADDALDLIDGARVHIKGHCCRTAYEQRWRAAATRELAALGLQPPATAL